MRKTLFICCFLVMVLILSCGSPDHRSSENTTQFVDTGVNPNTWALIPAGEFYRGQHAHETMVDYDYEIMVTDVTNQQYAAYLNTALGQGLIKIDEDSVSGNYPGEHFDGHKHEFEYTAGDYIHLPLGKAGQRIHFQSGKFTVSQGFENHPVVMVSWFGAKAFADFHGWRLPTEIEWEKAARGTETWAYPWGDDIARNQANYYSSHDLFHRMFSSSTITTPVGFFNGRTYDDYQTKAGQSPFGLYDMAGNVWQWTADDYHDTHLRYLRGGSQANYEYNLRVWARNSAGPDHFGINIGFRCVRSPHDHSEPHTHADGEIHHHH